MRHLVSLFDLSRESIEEIFARTQELKARYERGQRDAVLAGRVLSLVFEKPSLRTRVSFESAMAQLGGASVFLSGDEAGLGRRESLADFAQVLGQYVDAVVVRTFAHEVVEEFRRWSPCPVINGLSDWHHPCQALADLYTLKELWGDVGGRTLVFVGDGNNVARSLAIGCGKLGVRFVLAAPPSYQFPADFAEQLAKEVPDLQWEQMPDPLQAVRQADVIYTDVWISMGQESQADKRRREFAPYQVNGAMMKAAPKPARFMHCLPAHRGEEVTPEVIDGPQSIVIWQAANRLHVQKGLLVWLLGQRS